MAINLNDNINTISSKPLDNRYGVNILGATGYYETKELANGAILKPQRHIGLTVGIKLTGGTFTEYWYRDGIEDTNLIPKTLGSEISADNGLKLSATGSSAVYLGGTLLEDTKIDIAGKNLTFDKKIETRFPISSSGLSATFTSFSLYQDVTQGNLSSSLSLAGGSNLFNFYPAKTSIEASSSSEAYYTAGFNRFIFGAHDGSKVTSYGNISATASQGYFIYNSSIDIFINNRIMPPVSDANSPYTGTISELVGLRIDNQRTNTVINTNTTYSYGIQQKGSLDHNEFAGDTYFGNCVAIGYDQYGFNRTDNTRQKLFVYNAIDPRNIAGSGYGTTGSEVYLLNTIEPLIANINSMNGLSGGAALSGTRVTQNVDFQYGYMAGVSGGVYFAPAASITGTLCGVVANGIFQREPETLGISSGVLIIGQGYTINRVSSGMNFTNVGAPNNNQGTYFVATGTTPASWGTTISTIPVLKYDYISTTPTNLTTYVAFRATSPSVPSAVSGNPIVPAYYGTISNCIGLWIESLQRYVNGTPGKGTITKSYGIVQGDISDAGFGTKDTNIFNAEKNIFRNLPTSPTGLTPGTLWRDEDVVKVKL